MYSGIKVLLATLTLSAASWAMPVDITYNDTDSQDVLVIPEVQIHELGTTTTSPTGEIIENFPMDERIDATYSPTNIRPCRADFDLSGGPNYLVSISNASRISWTDLWYVADPETTITNDDGIVNGQLAFRIDSIGLNTPLQSGDTNSNGCFDPGETWSFVVQNYVNSLGLLVTDFSSVGVGDQSAAGPVSPYYSSGSIIAVPEPVSLTLLTAGILLISKRKKS